MSSRVSDASVFLHSHIYSQRLRIFGAPFASLTRAVSGWRSGLLLGVSVWMHARVKVGDSVAAANAEGRTHLDVMKL